MSTSKTDKHKRPEFPYTVFLDRTHGKAMAALLRKVRIPVKSIWQVYPKKKHEDIQDPDWIARCGREGWVAISGDKGLIKNVENRNALIDAKCKLFLLGDTHSLPEEWAAAVIAGRDKIESVSRKNDGPFYAKVSRLSSSHVTHAKFFDADEAAAAVGAE